jgi:peptidyl-prolyl cis-trans isomerase B (cyclophilin B)
MRIIKVILAMVVLVLLLVPACKSKTTMTIPMSNYANETYGYSIDYPQNWTLDDSASFQIEVVSPETITQSGTLGNNKAGILVMVNMTLSTAEIIPLETYYKNIYDSISQSASTAEIKEISVGNVTFGQNISGYTATWQLTDTAGKWEWKLFISEVHVSYSYYYLVLTYYLMDDAKSYAGPLNSAVESFKQTGITVTPAIPKKVYDTAPPMTIDVNKQYTVTMTTTYGDMVFQLFPADAPQTVNSFVFLIREGFYDDTVFLRVVDNFVVQGGDPTGTGMGGPGYTFPDEISSRKHLAGTLSMANSGADTNGSQFFICYDAQPTLDGKHTIFGQLVQGTDVLNKINKNDRLIKVTVEEK